MIHQMASSVQDPSTYQHFLKTTTIFHWFLTISQLSDIPDNDDKAISYQVDIHNPTWLVLLFTTGFTLIQLAYHPELHSMPAAMTTFPVGHHFYRNQGTLQGVYGQPSPAHQYQLFWWHFNNISCVGQQP